MALDSFWLATIAGSLLTYLTLRIMGPFKRKNHFPVNGRTVLITGGSQGMGKAVAQLLASKGANIIIVARDTKKLEAALEEIKSSAKSPSTQRFHSLSFDLSLPESSPSLLAAATSWNNNTPPPIIFMCAGSAHPGYFLDLPPTLLASQMNMNFFSAAYLAHAACRAWLSNPPSSPSPSPSPSPESREQEKRHLIFTSSVLAFLPMVGYTPYTPAKAALRSLQESLSQELLLYSHPPRPSHPHQAPIKTHTIYPATITSPGHDAEELTKPEITKKLEASDPVQTPAQVALASVAGLERGEESIVTGVFPGRVLRAGMLGGSKRAGRGVVDTILAGVVSVVFPWVRRDMDGQVRKWGQGRDVPFGGGGKKDSVE